MTRPTKGAAAAIALLCAAPSLLALLSVVLPLTTDPAVLFSGLAYDFKPNWLPGFSTIDPNQGFTSDALGIRAALDLLSGRAPLWNPYEGLGAPLLGEMQAAALFPPTLLLLLPHGQLIEQTFLQIVAGLGTYLFLRRFGLGVTAALAGGLLFEFNGVFAWLRNAIYNPVALLPWLFYAVETLFAAGIAGRTRRERGGTIALGAVAAALALYAGFPEVVFYYCLPLFGWALLRATCLPWRRAIYFAGDLILVGLLALLLAAPLLLAFGHFLAEGHVGDHTADGFKDAVIPPGGAVMYLLPYVFGPISFSLIPAIARFWGNGGYLGLTAFVLAIGGVLTGWRRPAVWLLAVWVSFAVGVTHDAPFLLAAFRHVPLVTISVFSRYLNAGWLFCAVTLAAVFIDRLPTLGPAQRRWVGLAAAGLGALGLAGALALAWPELGAAWQPHGGYRIYIVGSCVMAAALLAGAVAATWTRRPAGALVALAAFEAMLLFAFPFASSPNGSQLDKQLVRFLQRNVGLQRVASASGSALSPNYGSAFGIPAINYDDLPVPSRTVAFMRRELDPDLVPIMFRPTVSAGARTPAERQADFLARIPAYARAGVRYVLATPDFFAAKLALAATGMRPIPLAAGQSVTMTLQPPPHGSAITAVSVLIGTYGGQSDGRLQAQFCQQARCQQASADLATAADNVALRLPLDPPFARTDAPYQLTLAKQGGDHVVALWSKPPLPSETARASGLELMAGLLPDIALENADAPRSVLRTPTTAVFEIADVRPYASAPGCRVVATSQQQMTADCDQPSRLTRLEVLMEGWTARVNGAATPVALVDDTFQAVELPAGHSTVEFVYAPTGVRPALWVAAATLLGLLALALAARRGSGPHA